MPTRMGKLLWIYVASFCPLKKWERVTLKLRPAFVFRILRNPPFKIGEIIGDICSTGGSHTRLDFGGPSPVFYRVAKTSF